MAEKYRLITRSDFDGLVCAVLLKDLDLIDEIKFVHPKDMQDGIIKVTDTDITTNLPYVEGVYMAFDHHLSETIRNKTLAPNHIIDPDAASAARVVYNHYKDQHPFRPEWDEMMEAVDKADSAQFSEDEILEPNGWVLLNYLMDARTGLGRFRAFRISNYTLMMELIDYCKEHSIEEILALPDVQERVELYMRYQDDFKKMIKENARVYDEIVVVDLRDVDPIFPGNRFITYALFPEITISIQVMWGLKKQNTVFTVGKSIVNRSSDTNIGEIMLKFGGGGHRNAGTCQVPNDKAEELLIQVISQLKD
jgi:nanoRNase/pAp phosphatase (c-di-AMP/oligoRNAs hydrolase)